MIRLTESNNFFMSGNNRPVETYIFFILLECILSIVSLRKKDAIFSYYNNKGDN